MRLLPALLAAALLPFAAGCGGSDAPGAGAATVVPADVAVFVSFDTDFDGDQWQAVESLAAKFPGGENLLERIAREIEEDGDLDFEADVDPALGPETALVVLELTGEEPVFVGLTQPDDPAALERLAAEGDEPAVVREVDGWHVIAETEAAIDSFVAARDGSTLAGSEGYERAMDGLEEDALARLYVDGAALEAAGPAASAGSLGVLLPGGATPTIGGVLRAEDDGGRLDGRIVYEGGLEESGFATEPYEAGLPERIPGGVLAYVSFRDLEGVFSAYRDALAEASPEFESQLGQAEAVLGVSLEEDLAPLFAGEGALYVRGGALIPEVTLVTEVEDEAQAAATLDRLVAGLGAFVPVGEPRRSDLDGADVRELPISPPFSLYYTAVDGLLVVTTSREGIADLRADGERVADDESFREALDRAGTPDETIGFAYVDLAEVAPLLLGFAQFGENTDSAEVDRVRAYVEPLQSLVAWGTAEDDAQRFTLFLGIE